MYSASNFSTWHFLVGKNYRTWRAITLTTPAAVIGTMPAGGGYLWTNSLYASDGQQIDLNLSQKIN
jgi:hypothetical protein